MANNHNEKNAEKNQANSPNNKNKSYFPRDYWDFLFRSSEVHEIDINSLVLNYLLQPGYEEIAEEFCQEEIIEFNEYRNNFNTERTIAHFESLSKSSNIPSGMIEVKRSLRRELNKNNFCGTKELLNSISPQILENNETLIFMLNLQELVNLIVQKKTLEAIKFARKHMKSYVSEKKPKLVAHLENAMSLLAYDNFETGQAKETLNQLSSLSSGIMELTYNAFFEFYKINKDPILHTLLKDVIHSHGRIQLSMNITPPDLNEFETGKLKLSASKLSNPRLLVWFSKSTMIQHQQIHDEIIIITQSNNQSQSSQRYPNNQDD